LKGASQLQNRTEELEEARLKGLNQGIRQEKVSTVLTMHGMAFSIEKIAMVTRLTTEEVDAIILENWR
jgi:predicted transposase YdaD